MHPKAQEVLGDEFWSEINKVVPKRGPCIDMFRTKNEIVVVIEIPGIYSSENLNVKLKGFKLLINGEIPWTYPAASEDMIQSERFIGNFKRELTLPHDIAPDGLIDAQFKNGLVEIHIPRAIDQEEKDIPIDFTP